MTRPPLPLLEWQPPLAARPRRRRVILLAGAVGLALLGASAALDFAINPAPLLVWNASASAPIGFWRIDPRARIDRGDMVLVHTPGSVRQLAARRHYLPANVPLLKRVVAREGSEVCALGPTIFIDGRLTATRHKADRQGRPLPWWHGCEHLHQGQLFLLMDHPDSFDGRYFGPVDETSVIGKATPLWLR